MQQESVRAAPREAGAGWVATSSRPLDRTSASPTARPSPPHQPLPPSPRPLHTDCHHADQHGHHCLGISKERAAEQRWLCAFASSPISLDRPRLVSTTLPLLRPQPHSFCFYIAACALPCGPPSGPPVVHGSLWPLQAYCNPFFLASTQRPNSGSAGHRPQSNEQLPRMRVCKRVCAWTGAGILSYSAWALSLI